MSFLKFHFFKFNQKSEAIKHTVLLWLYLCCYNAHSLQNVRVCICCHILFRLLFCMNTAFKETFTNIGAGQDISTRWMQNISYRKHSDRQHVSLQISVFFWIIFALITRPIVCRTHRPDFDTQTTGGWMGKRKRRCQ